MEKPAAALGQKTVSTAKGQKLYRQARKRIPGGTQLLSKRPEMFAPGVWPPYYASASGAEVVDLDGNRYVDMSYAGIGSCVLGYGDPDVDNAAKAAIDAGSMSTLNCPEEVELAELLCELHPWADMVRYARSGGEALAIAVRVARASNGRPVIAFCGYHGWSDWYLAANIGHDGLKGHLIPGLSPQGVPSFLEGTALPFTYNRLDELDVILANNKGNIAAIMMEPRRRSAPAPGFLEGVRERATAAGIPLIFDEVTVGMRLNTGGLHLRLGIEPDIAVFAKGLSNGYPMAAVIGKATIMESFQDTFVSSTYWTERIGPSAAIATIRKHQKINAPEILTKAGERVQEGWRLAAEKTGFPITIAGIPPLSAFTIEHKDAQLLRTLFTERMLDEGFLAANAFYAMCTHTNEQVDNYLVAVERTFAELKDAIDQGNAESRLRGRIADSGFARLV